MKIEKSLFQFLIASSVIVTFVTGLILICGPVYAGNSRPSGPGMGVGDSIFSDPQPMQQNDRQPQKSIPTGSADSAQQSFDCGKVMNEIQNRSGGAEAPVGSDLTAVCNTMEVMNKIANKILNESGSGKVTASDVENAVALFSSEIEKQFPESYVLNLKHPLLKFFISEVISEAHAVRSGEIACDGTNCRKTFFRNLTEGLKKFFMGLVGMSKSTGNDNMYKILNGEKVTVDAQAVGNIVGAGLSYVCPALKGVRTGFAFINFVQEFRRRGNVAFRKASVEYETRGQNQCCSGG